MIEHCGRITFAVSLAMLATSMIARDEQITLATVMVLCLAAYLMGRNDGAMK